MITVLRNPFDRTASLYHYWREVESDADGPVYAKTLDFDSFIDIAQDITVVKLATVNSQTWQLAFGATSEYRDTNIDLSEDELLEKAICNLEKFAVVGVTEAMPKFIEKLNKRFNPPSPIIPARKNITKSRVGSGELPIRIRRKIGDLVYLDLALYEHVLKKYIL